MATVDNTVQMRFELALSTLLEKLKQDSYVMAVILLGSMSHDVVWEKSDIDLLIVTQEVKIRYTNLTLTEEGIPIHAFMYPRSQFKQVLEGSCQSSFIHSLLSKGRILFTRDETMAELFEARFDFGARDRSILAMRFTAEVLPGIAKAEKWLKVKHDADYCLLYILLCARSLAAVETVLNGEITGREVIHQALRLNPTFFHSIYTDLLHRDNSEQRLQTALDDIQGYLRQRISVLFQPVLDYLSEAGTTRSATEIVDYFSKQMRLDGVDLICEWLADEDIIRKVSTPVRITEKSRVNVEEMAYYYDAE